MAAKPRIYRVRRTVAPNDPAGLSPLRRALWGLSSSAVSAALQHQESEFAADRRLVDQQIDEERTLLQRLQEQIEAQRRRIQSLRGVIEALRDKLAKERAARSVLAARLLERQVEEQKAIQSSMARLETARMGADVKQEHEALRQLVAALYRSIAGRWGVPANLAVPDDLEPPRSPSAKLSHRSALTRGGAPGPQWHQFLLGKKSGTTLQAPDGSTIALEGETIGPENVAAAEAAGMLFDLILHMKVAEKIPDL